MHFDCGGAAHQAHTFVEFAIEATLGCEPSLHRKQDVRSPRMGIALVVVP